MRVLFLLGCLVALANAQGSNPSVASSYEEWLGWLQDGARGVIVTDFAQCTNVPESEFPYANSIIHVDWGYRVERDGEDYVETTEFSIIKDDDFDGGATVRVKLDSSGDGELTVVSTRFSFPDVSLVSELISTCPFTAFTLFAFGVDTPASELRTFDEVQAALLAGINIRASYDWDDCDDIVPETEGFSAFFYTNDLRWYIPPGENATKIIRATQSLPLRHEDDLAAITIEIELQEDDTAKLSFRRFASDGSVSSDYQAMCALQNGVTFRARIDGSDSIVAQTFDQIQNLIFLTGKEAFVNVQVDSCQSSGDPILDGTYIVRQRVTHWIWDIEDGSRVIDGLTADSRPILGGELIREVQSLELRDNDRARNTLILASSGGLAAEVFDCPISSSGLTVSTPQVSDRPRLETPEDVRFNAINGIIITMIVDLSSCIDEDGNPGAPTSTLYSAYIRWSLLGTSNTWIFYDYALEVEENNLLVAQYAAGSMATDGSLTLQLTEKVLADWSERSSRILSCPFEAAIFV